MADTPSDTPPSSSTPKPPNARFTSQASTAEEVLKEQTVGLVHLSDFRKRRAEALEQVSRDATPAAASGGSTPDGRESATTTVFKKKEKKRKKGVKTGGGLSFGGDDDEDDEHTPEQKSSISKTNDTADDHQEDSTPPHHKKRLQPNSTLPFAPKAHTKSALRHEAQLKETLRKQYVELQSAVRETDFCLPFVFFDGSNSSKDAAGGMCRMKKGDLVWLFLERARKVGAERVVKMGEGGKNGMMKDWARISVDDLMVVRGEMILGHHYDFHHFILNRTAGYNQIPLFPYSSEPTIATPQHLLPGASPTPTAEEVPPSQQPPSHLTTASSRQQSQALANSIRTPDNLLEGFSDDPSLTKVVDRRWYERNKHIYPASLWEEYDPEKDYAKLGAAGGGGRRDGVGNSYFF